MYVHLLPRQCHRDGVECGSRAKTVSIKSRRPTPDLERCANLAGSLDFELRTQALRQFSVVARQFYVEFYVGDEAPRSTNAAKEQNNRTCWNENLYL